MLRRPCNADSPNATALYMEVRCGGSCRLVAKGGGGQGGVTRTKRAICFRPRCHAVLSSPPCVMLQKPDLAVSAQPECGSRLPLASFPHSAHCCCCNARDGNPSCGTARQSPARVRSKSPATEIPNMCSCYLGHPKARLVSRADVDNTTPVVTRSSC